MRLGTRRAQLQAFDDVVRPLGIRGQWSVGFRTIPTAAIVGSVDRAHDFDSRFRPRARASGVRLRSLRRAFPDGRFPPISVYQVGDTYYVSDGHHRVALANMFGMCYLDAEVIRLRTEEPPPKAREPKGPHLCSDRVRVRDRVAAILQSLAVPEDATSWI